MKNYSVNTTIHASPETIWNLLTNAPSYPTWNPTVIKIEGTIAPGERIKVYSTLQPNRAFPVKVTEFVPGKRMTWTGGMPFGLFKGVRTYTLTPRNGSVDFAMREEFSGPLLGLIGKSIPDMTGAFREFADGLKKTAEKTMPTTASI